MEWIGVVKLTLLDALNNIVDATFFPLSPLTHSPSMQRSLIRLAESVTTKPLALQEANSALLPPKPLFRQILRSHRNLPSAMRSLGDDYVKAEFRRHRAVQNPVHIIGFLSQWKLYLEALPASEEGQEFSGQKLDPFLLEKMSSEQLGQLYELMQATKDVWKPSGVKGKDSEKL
ncbi:ACN9-domain-containing protein [Lentinula aciculospora]|uniref:Succinate dehydrogenase assembly factor 3 n=1 Tax=Lentinula aciculospora TaxID=153920 RepID=A0A9W9AFX0_9AGAR|nr:ACN9-domain-containing protein [Lentinula aciculospora]